MDGDLPLVDFDEGEFIRLMIENGHTPEDAESQATVCAALSSRVMIGDWAKERDEREDAGP